MTLSPGSRLGPYEILSLLGEGGMGEVYRARDTRLERVVAIKILPLHLSEDSQRRQRLEREARAISSLNHPHICALYDIGHHEESDYLVMEYLEGQTLADRLAKGAFSAGQVLRYAIEIADALDTAHRRGIIHRDLKPGNVMLTKSGAKLLDFGLAKLQEAPAQAAFSNLSAIPTGAQPLTTEGTILGTLPYMPPEQLEGKEADERSDIFAFGAIVYEMATGRKAFEAKSQASLIAAILEHDPPSISSLQPMTPAALDHLVTVCLAKDPDDRWQNAHDIKNEIRWIEATRSQAGISAPTAPRAKSRERFWIATTLILAAIVAAPLLWRNASEGSTGSPIKPIRVQRLTDFAGLEEFPAISPDGKSVAFAADTGGKWQIWVRLLAGGPPLQITHDPVNHQFPRWSVLSNSLIYFTAPVGSELQGTVWEISALGGAPHRLVDSLEGADLSHDGKKIAFLQPNNEGVQIAVSPLDVYTPHAVTRLAPGYKYSHIRWSPDDKWLSYQRETVFESDIFAVPSQGGDPFPITHEGTLMRGFCWLPDSSGIIYSSARGNTILYLPTFNLWTTSLGKSSVPRQLTFGEASYVHPDLKSGRSLVASRMSMKFDIWKFPVDGTPSDNVRRGVRITDQTGQVQTPSISPDNKELVYLSDSGGHGNLWVTRLDGSGARQITYERDADVAIGVPVWSPAGKDIAFVSTRNLPGWDFGLWLVSSDGSNVRNVAQRGGWGCWSPDGRFLYYAVSRNGKYQIEQITANGGSPVIVRTDNALSPAVDSNGVLYYAVQLGNINGISNFEIRAARPESGPSQLLAQIPGWRIPAWQPTFSQVLSPDGKWLVPTMLSDGPVSNIWALPTSGGPMRQLTDFAQRRTFIARRVSWSSDSKYIFAALGEGDSDVVLLLEILPGR